MIINSLDRSRQGWATVNGDSAGTDTSFLSDCSSDNMNNIAYWSPASTLECYETTYYLYDTGAIPATCAPNTFKLGRKVLPDIVDPMLDCVLDLDFRFGCISSSGALTWQAGTNCGTAKLRLVKVGMVVQSGTRTDTQWGASTTLFEDLSGQSKTVTFTSEQRYYKWRKIEQTITLKNLE